MDRLITKNRHSENQSEDLICGQASPADSSRTAQLKCRFNPLKGGDVVSKCIQIREVKQTVEVEKILLKHHKKSDAKPDIESSNKLRHASNA